MELYDKKNEIIKKMMEVEFYPSFDDFNFTKKTYKKIPISALGPLGIAFATMPESIRTLTSISTTSMEGLYRCTFPEGVSGTLAKFKDGSGYLGTIIGKEKDFAGQARWNPADNIITKNSAVIPYDPTMLFMSMTLLHIEKKLQTIEDNQKNILDFLAEDKKAEMLGNLNYLSDITRQYKFNYDNNDYINTMLLKVQDIKQDSEQKIILYKKQIEKFLDKNSLFIVNKDVKKRIHELEDQFKNYQMAEYLYSFSTFLYILLLKNFNESYLTSIVETLREHSFNYRELYTHCYNKIEVLSNSTIDSIIIKNVASFNKITGNTINKIPILEKGPVDEKLIEFSSKLDHVNKSQKDNILEIFTSCKNTYSNSFIDSIEKINNLYNRPLDICFDKENIYYID